MTLKAPWFCWGVEPSKQCLHSGEKSTRLSRPLIVFVAHMRQHLPDTNMDHPSSSSSEMSWNSEKGKTVNHSFHGLNLAGHLLLYMRCKFPCPLLGLLNPATLTLGFPCVCTTAAVLSDCKNSRQLPSWNSTQPYAVTDHWPLNPSNSSIDRKWMFKMNWFGQDPAS